MRRLWEEQSSGKRSREDTTDLFTSCTGSSLLCGLSLAVASDGSSLAVVNGLLVVVASLIAERRL